jgi:hypothetical protein
MAATSAAGNASTSRSSRTARWPGGSVCMPAIRASRRSARSPANGCTQASAGRTSGGPAAPSDGGPIPEGSARRPRSRTLLRQTLVAILCSHVRAEARRSKPSQARQPRR